MSVDTHCKNQHFDWLLEIVWLHVSEPLLLLSLVMLDMWKAKLSLCQSLPCWALLEASGSSVCKGDKPGAWCFFNGSLCSILVFLAPFSCLFPWSFIINSLCSFYTILGRMAHCIPLLARLCKEKDAGVSFDGFSLLAFGHSYLLDHHILLSLHPIFLPSRKFFFFSGP